VVIAAASSSGRGESYGQDREEEKKLRDNESKI
jgi:hypothetical protein